VKKNYLKSIEMKNNQNFKKARQAKFFLVLPLIALPFITLLFWALGGGNNAQARTEKHAGINLRLPNPRITDDGPASKLSFYEQAQKDSAKVREAEKEDPYYRRPDSSGHEETRNGSKLYAYGLNYAGAGNQGDQTLDDNERSINIRLAEIKKRVNNPVIDQTSNPASADDKGEHLRDLQNKISAQANDDPEMKQINGMLDKLMAIEHPDLVKQQLKAASERQRGLIFPVSAFTSQSDDSYFGSETAPSVGAGFLGIDSADNGTNSNSIAAIVHGTQTLTNGATIRLRLMQPVFINGVMLPQDNFIYGTCSLEGDRLHVDINNIRVGNRLFPVSLKVYDLDGLPGIRVPGAITRDAAKEGADEAIQSLDFYSMSPSVGAQAASAGVQAVKGLFSKKVRLIKVTVKSGYAVLLADPHQFNQ
jgi:conjugative transposon TraM protein